MSLPEHVTIVEVGPRDGLQNEPGTVPTDVKVAFIDRLARTGLSVVEATSFVSPRWVPQLADAAEVLAAIDRVEGVRYPVLVPNERGLDRALACGVDEIAVFAAASEAFSSRNLGRSIADSMDMFAPGHRARDREPACGSAGTSRWCAAAPTRARCRSTTSRGSPTGSSSSGATRSRSATRSASGPPGRSTT
jgi:hypothetical protein